MAGHKANLVKVHFSASGHSRFPSEISMANGVRTIINPHMIFRETKKEVWAQYQAILDHQEPVAAGNILLSVCWRDQMFWKAATSIKTRAVGFPIGLLNHRFNFFKSSPRLGELSQEVFREWKGAAQ